MFNGDVHSAHGFKIVLERFRECFGLQVNEQKYQIFCAGMSDARDEEIRSIIDFWRGERPVRYIGLPLIAKRLSHGGCLPLIDNVEGRIQS